MFSFVVNIIDQLNTAPCLCNVNTASAILKKGQEVKLLMFISILDVTIQHSFKQKHLQFLAVKSGRTKVENK